MAEKREKTWLSGRKPIPVYCVEDKKTFATLSDACAYAGLKRSSKTALKRTVEASKVSGKPRHSGRSPVTGKPLTWLYADNLEERR